MAEDEENEEQSEFTSIPKDLQNEDKKPSVNDGSWSQHKRGWIMTMGMSGLILISIVVWIFTKP